MKRFLTLLGAVAISAPLYALPPIDPNYDDYSETCDIPDWFDMDGPAEQCNPNNLGECFGFYHFNPNTMKAKAFIDGEWVDTDEVVPDYAKGYAAPDMITVDDIDKQSGYHFGGPTTIPELLEDAFGVEVETNRQ